MTKILGFDGSGRKGSMNKKLLKIVAQGAETAGAKVILIDLPEYNLPIYNGDVETQSGVPAKALELKKLVEHSDGILIACPEYNGGYTPLLKNTIDWITRPSDGYPQNPFNGKTVGLMGTSPGKLGALRSIYQLNTILFGLGVTVLPTIVSIGNYGEAFNEDGTLNDPAQAKMAHHLGQTLVNQVKST